MPNANQTPAPGKPTKSSYTQYLEIGKYYSTPFPHSSSSSQGSQDRAYFVPFYTDDAHTFDRIGIKTTFASNSGAVARLGIYDSDPDTGAPSDLILDAGTLATHLTEDFYAKTISQALPAGRYFLALATQGTVSQAPQYVGLLMPHVLGQSVPSNTGSSFINSDVGGALPATAGATLADFIPPRIWLRPST